MGTGHGAVCADCPGKGDSCRRRPMGALGGEGGGTGDGKTDVRRNTAGGK